MRMIRGAAPFWIDLHRRPHVAERLPDQMNGLRSVRTGKRRNRWVIVFRRKRACTGTRAASSSRG